MAADYRHRWTGRPGHWRCKRCQLETSDARHVTGRCFAGRLGRMDYDPTPAPTGAVPARLDTPERVNEELLPTTPDPALSGVRERIDEQ